MPQPTIFASLCPSIELLRWTLKYRQVDSTFSVRLSICLFVHLSASVSLCMPTSRISLSIFVFSMFLSICLACTLVATTYGVALDE